jgi:hypothetical protein
MDGIFLKGTTFAYTTLEAQIALTPQAALPALPISYGSDAEAGWVKFICVEKPEGFGMMTTETSEHRCINQADGLIRKRPTGFVTAETARLTLEFYQEEYDFFKTLERNRTRVRIYEQWPVRSDQETPFREAGVYLVTAVKRMNDSFTDSNKLVIEMELQGSPVYALGT